MCDREVSLKELAGAAFRAALLNSMPHCRLLSSLLAIARTGPGILSYSVHSQEPAKKARTRGGGMHGPAGRHACKMGSMLCLHYIGRAPHATHKQLAVYFFFLSLFLFFTVTRHGKSDTHEPSSCHCHRHARASDKGYGTVGHR